MEKIVAGYPDDMEAKIFYALAVSQNALATDKTYANQLKATAILEPLFREHPEHPGLAHYIIHAYDHPPLAPRAVDAARRYAKIAPSAPHALHMPSHTFTRVGYWQDSIASNIASAETASKLGTHGEVLHAMDYQIYAYLQLGQDAAARRVLDRLPEVRARFNPDAHRRRGARFRRVVRARGDPGPLRSRARGVGGRVVSGGALDHVSLGGCRDAVRARAGRGAQRFAGCRRRRESPA